MLCFLGQVWNRCWIEITHCCYKYEPKKLSANSKTDNEELDSCGNGAINTAHTRTAIREFVENYDRVKEKYAHTN